jgi:hypothetical protein
MEVVMAIRPVDIVTMQRMGDVSQLKQQEDSKPVTDQVNFQNQMTKETEKTSTQVVQKSDINNDQQKYDAKEKGKNEYHGDGRVKVKKKNGTKKVIDSESESGLFDVTV